MIIKGRAVGNIGHWSRYLRAQGENEKVIEHEVRGTLARDLRGALEEWRDLSTATRTEGNFMYHASFNPSPGEVLTPEQWRHSVDLLEKELGFEGHQRVIYEHVKEGRSHYHVLWNRVDPETMTIRDIQGDRYTCRRVSNQLEREFGLTRTKAVRDYGDARPYHEWELKRSTRDVKLITKEITELWYSTKTGREFTDAIEHAGYIVTKGDRRDFCIIDPTGKDHSLARRIAGNNTRALRERMKDIDRDSLPTVAEGRARQRDADRTSELVSSLLRDNPGIQGLAHDLDERQLMVARATAPDIAQLRENIDRRNQDAESAWLRRAAEDVTFPLTTPRPRAMTAPELKPDELVMVDKWGHAHKLNLMLPELAMLESLVQGHGAPEDIPTLSEAREHMATERREEYRQTFWKERYERQTQAAERAAANPSSGEAIAQKRDGADMAQAAIRVTSAASGAVIALADFVCSIFDRGPPQPAGGSAERLAVLRRDAALERMSRTLKRDNTVRGEDVVALQYRDITKIRNMGDPALVKMIEDLNRQRQRSREREL